jgi:hypothetical protein
VPFSRYLYKMYIKFQSFSNRPKLI